MEDEFVITHLCLDVEIGQWRTKCGSSHSSIDEPNPDQRGTKTGYKNVGNF